MTNDMNRNGILMMNKQETEYQKAAAASDMFQLLSMFMHLPKKEMAAGLLDGSMAEDVTTIFRELGFKTADIQNIKNAFENIRFIMFKESFKILISLILVRQSFLPNGNYYSTVSTSEKMI